MRSYLMVFILILSLTAIAEDRWIPIDKPTSPLDVLLLNVGHVVMNDNRNRVATVRTITGGGFRMDTVTEFDCRTHRQRSLSSALTDKDGRLISASAKGNTWFGGKDAIGLTCLQCSNHEAVIRSYVFEFKERLGYPSTVACALGLLLLSRATEFSSAW